MKKLSFLAILIVLSFAFSIAFSQNQNQKTAEIKTSAVCEMCKERIEKKLTKVDGIESANLDVDTKVLNVTYDATKISLEDIKKKISKIGYDADDVKRDPKGYKKLPKCCRIDG
ncbi:MAG: heavy-metal-associated domain-containing protein [Candidatus Kapaibacteriota bacterium]|jgi:copper chaperone CopZ